MNDTVLLLNAETVDAQDVCPVLESNGFKYRLISRIEELEGELRTAAYMAVILDIDSFSITNRVIRELTLAFPGICFLCTSKDRFHPELKDAICYHIYACITKPVDPDELIYLLRCIRNDGTDSDPPRIADG